MENNKENIEIIETSCDEVIEEVTPGKFKTILSKIGNFFKSIWGALGGGRMKNQALLKRGSFSLIITALILALLVGFNWLTSSLGERFRLEFDMTQDKKNSMTEENIKYLEGLDLTKSPVTITVCAAKNAYLDAMVSLASELYQVSITSYNEAEYFNQTQKLLDKYPSYNENITVKYVDPESTEYAAITQNYPNYNNDIIYGDILVTASVDGNNRIEHLTFEDIYVITADSYTYSYVLTANRLETALTSAIASVTNPNTKKVAVLSGHSNNTHTEAYIELLKLNNYSITEIPDKLITSISSDFDILVLASPTIDFGKNELDVIDAFLNNDGKLGKGFIFFADATCPYLPDLYGRLKQWGIEISEGVLYGTSGSDRLPASPHALIIDPISLQDDDITSTIKSNTVATEYNVPMKAVEAYTYEIQSTALMKTKSSVVVAPVGVTDWTDYTDEDKQSYDCVIQSKRIDFDSENNEISSYIMAFSSVEFIQSRWAQFYPLANQDMVMLATNRAAHLDKISVYFTSKVIQDESFSDKVTLEDVKKITTTFMVVLPLAIIVIGIIVFIRRKNAR